MTEINKREQILMAAAEVFSKTGYHSTRVVDIALKANIGKGTVYEYFRSKRELFEDTISYVLEEYFIQAKACLKSMDDPIAKLKGFIKLHIAMLKKNENTIALFIRPPTDVHNEMVKRLMLYKNKVFNFIAAIIEEGVEAGVIREIDPDFAAILFMGMLHGLGAKRYRDFGTDNDTPDMILDYLINGIGEKNDPT